MNWPIAEFDAEEAERRTMNFAVQAMIASHDIHVLQACNIFNCTPDKVTGEMRRLGKLENYFRIYGGRH